MKTARTIAAAEVVPPKMRPNERIQSDSYTRAAAPDRATRRRSARAARAAGASGFAVGIVRRRI
jgi:hypothetical protein